MQLQQRINAFIQLGQSFKAWSDKNDFPPELLIQAKAHNGWFTEQNITYAFKSWANALQEKNIENWLAPYKISEIQFKNVAIILAGNIPLVGLHDIICVLITGHKVIAKASSNDSVLIRFVLHKLIEIEPQFADKIVITKEKLAAFDAVIATGSNNTAQYFDYYFGKYPHIIRKNRNSVAVLSGKESEQELEALSNDIFLYFGLGCRNVSKVFIPNDYNLNHLFKAFYLWKNLIYNDKYMNNYDYNKAVYLMGNQMLWDNEFILLKEDPRFYSPIGVVYYEYYNDLEAVKQKISEHKDQLQCVVGKIGLENEITFGKTQSPALWDYADGVDTLSFLLNL